MTPDMRAGGADRRARMVRLLAFAAACALAVVVLATAIAWRPTMFDAWVYWQAWHGPLYGSGFIYPPPGAIPFAPAALVSWPVFAAAWFGLLAAAGLWLLWPVPMPTRVPLFLALVGTFAWGNAATLLAVPLALAPRWPLAWTVLAWTKITPAAGAAVLLAQRRWRDVAVLVVVSGAIAVATIALVPDMVAAWLRELIGHAWVPRWLSSILPTELPLVVRLPAAAVIGLGAARRPWLLAVAAVVATPDLSLATCGLLAATPRLAQVHGPAEAPESLSAAAV